MKKLLILLPLIAALFSSCKKEGSGCNLLNTDKTATTPEIAHIQAHVNSNSIPAVQHPSGFFYVIHDQGSGARPEICSTVFVKYTGRIMETGGIFDQNLNGYSTIVGDFILGAQKGLQLLNKGGKIDLYIPPSLGYEDHEIVDQNGTVIIPAGSYLKFEIELVDVQ